MKTFIQWLWWKIKEKLGILSPSLGINQENSEVKMEKFIPNWVLWLIGILAVTLYFLVMFGLLS